MTALKIDDVGRKSLSRARKGSAVTFSYGALGGDDFAETASLVVQDKSIDTSRHGGPICHLHGYLVGSEVPVRVRVYRGYKSALLIMS